MKFQEFLSIKESLQTKGTLNESMDSNQTRQLIKEYIDTVGLENAIRLNPQPVAGSYQKLNENLEEIMKKMKAYMAYDGADSELANFEKVLRDQKLKPLAILDKTMNIDLVVGRLKEQAKKLPKEKKIQVLQKAEQLEAKKDQLESQKDVLAEKLKQAVDASTGKYDESKKIVEGGSPDLASLLAKKKTSITNKINLEELEKKAEQAKALKHKGRQSALANNIKDAQEKYDAAMKRLEDGEDASEEDMNEIEGVSAVKNELKAYVTASNKLKPISVSLGKIVSEANGLKEGDYISGIYDVEDILSEDYDDWDFISEDESEEGSATPGKAYSAVKGITEKEFLEDKKKLLEKLKGLVDTWKNTKQEQIDTKKALFDKASALTQTTKNIITLAGGKADEAEEVEKDGKVVGYKYSGEMIDKWKKLVSDGAGESGGLEGGELVDFDTEMQKVDDEIAGAGGGTPKKSIDDQITDLKADNDVKEEEPTDANGDPEEGWIKKTLKEEGKEDREVWTKAKA